MKRLILLLCLCLLVVAPTIAFRDDMQDYTHPDLSDGFPTWGFAGMTLYQYPTGVIDVYNYGNTLGSIRTITPSTFTYAAFDTQSSSGGAYFIYLLDSSNTTIATLSTSGLIAWTHEEVKIIGGTPTLFENGVQVATAPVISVNPTYMVVVATAFFGVTNEVDNVLVGESDHHLVAALPSNGTILRDLINPSSTGFYMWDGSAWALKDSNHSFNVL